MYIPTEWLVIIVPIVGAVGLWWLVTRKHYWLAAGWTFGFWFFYWAAGGSGSY